MHHPNHKCTARTCGRCTWCCCCQPKAAAAAALRPPLAAPAAPLLRRAHHAHFCEPGGTVCDQHHPPVGECLLRRPGGHDLQQPRLFVKHHFVLEVHQIIDA